MINGLTRDKSLAIERFCALAETADPNELICIIPHNSKGIAHEENIQMGQPKYKYIRTMTIKRSVPPVHVQIEGIREKDFIGEIKWNPIVAQYCFYSKTESGIFQDTLCEVLGLIEKMNG